MMRSNFFDRGRPKKPIEIENKSFVISRRKEKQRRIELNLGIENLRNQLIFFGFNHHMSKHEVLIKTVELINELEKRIDIFICENKLLKLINYISIHDYLGIRDTGQCNFIAQV